MKYKAICLILVVIYFLSIHAFAQKGQGTMVSPSLGFKEYTEQYKGNFLKICAELSNGETDFKKYIGEKISFNYFATTYKKDKNGSVTFEQFWLSPMKGSYGAKVLILNPLYSSYVAPIDTCLTTGIVKAIDIAKKMIIVDQANICYTSEHLK